MSRGGATPPAGGAVEDWHRLLVQVVDAVRFERQPIDGLDRLVGLIVASDVFPEGPEACLTSLRAAVRSTDRIADLLPQPHTEGALRKLLVALEGRLSRWVEEGAAVAQVDFALWRPEAASPVVAQLTWEPSFLSRWLKITFDTVPDQLGEVRVAVLRLTSGRLVALAQVAGNPVPGTGLLQMGTSPPREVVAEFLADSRLSASVVEWTAAGQPHR